MNGMGTSGQAQRGRVLKPAGPWVRFIIDYLRALDADEPENTFCAAVDTKDKAFLVQGMRYWLFVYEMEQKGFSDTRTYEYVLVRIDDTGATCLAEDDKRLILRDMKVVKCPEDVPVESFPDARFAADDCAEFRRQQISEEASARNDVKIGSRIQAVRRQSEARARMLQDELIVARGQDELRIRKAIAREREKAEGKVAVLEEKMRHVATYSLDAVCLIIAR